jgi:subtilisin-like proprotein convertase family protein
MKHMGWRAFTWLLLSVLCFLGALLFWRLGEEWRLKKAAPATQPAEKTSIISPKAAGPLRSPPIALLSTTPQTNAAEGEVTGASVDQRFPFRLRNSSKSLAELSRSGRAILLENAFIDTTRPRPSIPEPLRAQGEPGSYIVQSRGPLDNTFRAVLKAAGGEIISYIPNNAYLVRMSGVAAQQIAAEAQTQSVMPYEPYYKLKPSLLRLAMEQRPLPENTGLKLVLFADAKDETVEALKRLEAEIVSEQRSPFGPVVTVRPQPGSLTQLAGLPGVQNVEWYRERVPANDLSRVRVGVAVNPVTNVNYLGLTGSNLLVNLNDTGVDWMHPDLTNRVFSDVASSLVDSNGHGTHVAGVIAGSGAVSATVTNARNSSNPGLSGQYRGKAPAARLFTMATDLSAGPFQTDEYLQETAARTNAFVSNNSWHYAGDNEYDIAAASYDAAVRDALPTVTGSQPLLYVFSAGNTGGGNDDGLGGFSDTVQSPGTAKNVITVGAIEQFRDITNEVWRCVGTNYSTCITNQPWVGETSSSNQVAAFSARGNTGIGSEGLYGRYKPDVVAPGTFIISTTEKAHWDQISYYDPTNHHFEFAFNQVVRTNSQNNYALPIPENAVQAFITVYPRQAVDLPIYVNDSDIPTTNAGGYDFFRLNQVSMPPDGGNPLYVRGSTLQYSVANFSTQNVVFDLQTEIVTTNDNGNYFEVLSNLNNTLGPYYRYESGTSMSAGDVSGALALMQEFFELRLGRTNSPALMKALLINGARSVNTIPGYDFQVKRSRQNFEGWGLISLSNSVPSVLTSNTPATTTSSMHFFDQSPTNALATGHSQTRFITLAPAARIRPLRLTLVWTDPPGNPAASLKLVNNLDLIVTNLTTGEVYFGNDIHIASNFNEPWDTNAAPDVDIVNNVENIYIPYIAAVGPLASNYSVTVVGQNVNVNAVTGHSNDVVQDYALVISSAEGQVVNALTVTQNPVVGLTNSSLTRLTNAFAGTQSEVGQLLLKQRAGANTPLLGTTNGMTNQWQFYVITNSPRQDFTNAAFVTFLPPTISIPRMGVREDDVENATRGEGDIDLYVSTDPDLLRLSPAAVAAARQSRGRGGTEVVIYTNAVPNTTYYVGVKSEDQEGVEYGLLGVFSDEPFSEDENGTVHVRGFPVPTEIPDGSPENPGGAFVFGIAAQPVDVRRVVVTNAITHGNFGDLISTLSHNQKFTVLHNHSTGDGTTNQTFVYEDNGEGGLLLPAGFQVKNTDGPGSLRDFVGEEGVGLWLLTMVDNSLSHTGQVNNLGIRLEPNQTNDNTVTLTVAPNSWVYAFRNVPIEATNLTVCVADNTAPLELYILRGDFPTRSSYLKRLIVPPGGGCLTIGLDDIPPLNSGPYYIGVFNPGAVAQTIRIITTVELDLARITPTVYTVLGNEPILDDRVSYSAVNVPDDKVIAGIEVGLRVDHPRVSDMVFHLISPSGKRVLLFENRTGTNAAGLGGGVLVTNAFFADAGGPNAQSNSIPVGQNQGTLIIDYNFFQIPDEMHIYYDGNLIRNTGPLSGSGRFSLNFGPGISTDIVIIMNEAGNTNSGTMWNYTATVVSGTFNYFTFTENTNQTQTPVKFASPPYANPAGSRVVMQSGFEGSAAADYIAPAVVDGWTVLSNQVTVINDAPLALTGTNLLALADGQISRALPTTPGKNYRLSFAYRGPNIVSWWRAQNDATDSVDGNNGTLAGNVTYAAGEVGQAFVFDGDRDQINVSNPANLQLQNFTIEGWVKRSSTTIATLDGFIGPQAAFFAYGRGGYGFALEPDGRLHLTRIEISNRISPVPLVPDTAWHHIAVTKIGTAVVFFGDGVAYPVAPYPETFTFTTRAAVGSRGDGGGNTFWGMIDEMSIYNRALSSSEIKGIYNGGAAGKYDPAVPAPQNLAKARVAVEGYSTNIFGQNTNWTTHVIPFTASQAGAPMQVDGLEPGMLLDAFTLIEVNPAGVFYFPEESLKSLVGENAQGQWRLEMWDNRVGPPGPVPTLVSWQLKFIYENTAPALTGLQHATPVTNSVPAGSIRYYYVDVPPWASFATNILINATGPLNVYFNQFLLPTGTNAGDVKLIGPATSGTALLQTNGAPPLIPGRSYYLGLQNPGGAQVDFAFEVDFDIIPLTNAVSFTNSVASGSVPQYYQFDVSTNAQAVAFEVFNADGNVDLIVRKGVPLPTLASFDYGSFNTSSNDEVVVVATNSAPVALTSGRWYLGVFNRDAGPVAYTVRATEIVSPQIICLTNGVPFSYTAAPGNALTNFFCFQIDRTNAAALFELCSLSGNVDLTLQRGSLPLAPPYFGGSFNSGTNYEQIVIRTNASLPDINDTWYLAVPNNEATNVNFTIRAVVSTNGLLVSCVPMNLMTSLAGTNGLQLTWNAVDGERYQILVSTNLINWSVLTNIVGAGNRVIFIDPAPVAGIPMRFYRINQVP